MFHDASGVPSFRGASLSETLVSVCLAPCLASPMCPEGTSGRVTMTFLSVVRLFASHERDPAHLVNAQHCFLTPPTPQLDQTVKTSCFSLSLHLLVHQNIWPDQEFLFSCLFFFPVRTGPNSSLLSTSAHKFAWAHLSIPWTLCSEAVSKNFVFEKGVISLEAVVLSKRNRHMRPMKRHRFELYTYGNHTAKMVLVAYSFF